MKTIEEKIAARQALTKRRGKGHDVIFPIHKAPVVKKTVLGIRKIRGNRLYG
jgi:hypothetical protein